MKTSLREACEHAEAMLRDGGTFPIKGQTWQLLRDALQEVHSERVTSVKNEIPGAKIMTCELPGGGVVSQAVPDDKQEELSFTQFGNEVRYYVAAVDADGSRAVEAIKGIEAAAKLLLSARGETDQYKVGYLAGWNECGSQFRCGPSKEMYVLAENYLLNGIPDAQHAAYDLAKEICRVAEEIAIYFSKTPYVGEKK
jgi:hypothetical protein